MKKYLYILAATVACRQKEMPAADLSQVRVYHAGIGEKQYLYKNKHTVTIVKIHSISACLLVALTLVGCTSRKKPLETPKDQLVHQLFSYAEKGQIAYGHQDDLVYGHNWVLTDWEDDPLERSDVKDVTGQYPMVLGFDLGGIELGHAKNLDGVPFGLIRKATQQHVQRGGIVTFSWHPRNPLTGGDAWDTSSKEAVSSLLEEGVGHEEFMQWLERAADFIASLEVPVIMRPWHENLGSWFWWGGNLCTPQEYKSLFRMTRDYFSSRGLENILWCYSPNGSCTPEEYQQRYPGDDYVDIVGVDTYEFMGEGTLEEAAQNYRKELLPALDFLKEFSSSHGKLMCLSETGFESIPDSKWWTQTLFPAIKDYPVCYVLTWRNAHDRPEHFYAPWKGFAGAEDFKVFAGYEQIVLL
ncbi:MAG: glycoside hydrolase family 26 protein [Bacteroidales bacterium]|nr:glycoside hydrolase family 26 protein [Bacteroidales bacterium]